MKTYKQLINYDVKKYGLKFIFPIVLILGLTIYRVCFQDFNKNIFEISDPAKDMPVILLFVILQIIVLLGLVLQLKSFLRSEMFINLPDIREKVIVYKGILLSCFFIWSILFSGIRGYKQILFYSFIFIWLLSFLLVLLWGFKYIYRSKKYILLKIAFQFGILWVPYLISLFKNQVTLIVLSYIFLLIFIHLKNFKNNFINSQTEEKKDNEGIRHYLEGDFEEVFGNNSKQKNIDDLIKKITVSPSTFDYVRLYQYSLYKYTGSIILFIIIWFITSVLLPVLYNFTGTVKGNLIISIIILLMAYRISCVLKNRKKIESIYQLNKLSRKDFNKNILYTVIWYYSRIIFFICFFIAYYDFKIFARTVIEFDPFIHLAIPLISVFVGYMLIYFNWKRIILRNSSEKISQSGE